jgi:hypothetical protein
MPLALALSDPMALPTDVVKSDAASFACWRNWCKACEGAVVPIFIACFLAAFTRFTVARNRHAGVAVPEALACDAKPGGGGARAHVADGEAVKVC